MSFKNLGIKNNTEEKFKSVKNVLFTGEDSSSMSGLKNRQDVNEYLSGIDKGDFFGASGWKAKRKARRAARKSGANILEKAQSIMDAMNDNYQRLQSAVENAKAKNLKKGKLKRFTKAYKQAVGERDETIKKFNLLKQLKKETNNKKILRKAYRQFTRSAKRMERKVNNAYNISIGLGFGKGLMQRFSKYNPLFIIIRNSVLFLIKENVFNIAAKMGQLKTKAESGDLTAKKGWNKLIDKWLSFGGLYSALSREIVRGKDKHPLLNIKIKKKTGIDGSFEYFLEFENAQDEELYNQKVNYHFGDDGYSYVAQAAAPAPIVGAAPFLVVATPILGLVTTVAGMASKLLTKKPDGSSEDSGDDISSMAKDLMDKNGVSEEDQAKILDPDNKEQMASSEEGAGLTSGNTTTYLIIGGLVLTGIGLLIFVLTRKKGK